MWTAAAVVATDLATRGPASSTGSRAAETAMASTQTGMAGAASETDATARSGLEAGPGDEPGPSGPGLRLVLASTEGDLCRVRMGDDGSTVGLWQQLTGHDGRGLFTPS